jgi:hypothetical protein
MNIKLVRTCEACPEQYDAYLGKDIVGYLRLRHGTFTVTCPDVGGDDVYVAQPTGDGIFDDTERELYLQAATHAIIHWLNKSTPMSGAAEYEEAIAAQEAMEGL